MPAKEVKLKKGDVLIREGSESDSMYLLQEGSLAVFKRKGAKDALLGHIHTGELVGEMSFLDQEPRSATVIAATDATLVEIPHQKFVELFQSQPTWFQSLIKTLLNRLRATNAKVKI